MVAHEPEIIDLQRQREFGDRIAQQQSLLELPFLIGRGEFSEFLGSKIARAVVQLRLVLFRHANLDTTEAPVGHGVCVVIAQDVIAAQIVLSLLHALRQIVAVQERFAAGVFGQCEERLLLVVQFGLLRGHGLSRKDRVAARSRLAGISAGRQRDQTPRIHGIEGDVGADGGVDGGFQLRVILNARLGNAAGEINQRLFLG